MMSDFLDKERRNNEESFGANLKQTVKNKKEKGKRKKKRKKKNGVYFRILFLYFVSRGVH